jgi:hypothetical protein
MTLAYFILTVCLYFDVIKSSLCRSGILWPVFTKMSDAYLFILRSHWRPYIWWYLKIPEQFKGQIETSFLIINYFSSLFKPLYISKFVILRMEFRRGLQRHLTEVLEHWSIAHGLVIWSALRITSWFERIAGLRPSHGPLLLL